MARAKKAPPPPLPVVFLRKLPARAHATMMKHTEPTVEHDVVAVSADGKVLRRWPWWSADKPRKRRASTMLLDGVRYQIELVGA